MSKDDYDDLYADETDMLEFNENLPNTEARVAMEEDVDEAISPLMFGRTGRGSPEMELIPENKLFRNAAKALRSEGMNDDLHLIRPRMVPINEQQKKEAEDEKRLDAYIDNIYKEEKKAAEDDARLDAYLDNMYKEMKTRSQKGGTRKRSKRSSRRNKRSTRRRSRKSRRNKRSRKGRK
jgi:hypothetical protein